jgi:hypothetical protein
MKMLQLAVLFVVMFFFSACVLDILFPKFFAIWDIALYAGAAALAGMYCVAQQYIGRRRGNDRQAYWVEQR